MSIEKRINGAQFGSVEEGKLREGGSSAERYNVGDSAAAKFGM